MKKNSNLEGRYKRALVAVNGLMDAWRRHFGAKLKKSECKSTNKGGTTGLISRPLAKIEFYSFFASGKRRLGLLFWLKTK